MRKRPIRHTVREHTRKGKSVRDYERGNGVRKQRKSRVVGSVEDKPIREQIKAKMEELASENRYRQMQYTALRKEFPDIPIKEFLETLETFHLTTAQLSVTNWIWRTSLKDPRFKRLRDWHMRASRDKIKYAKEHGTWDGVTIREIVKYMGELEKERGEEYASNHALLVYLRR